jgi:hypothetical protein
MSFHILPKDTREGDPELGYQVTLVSDAHTTEDSESAKAVDLIEEKNSTFSQVGAVLKTSEILF